MRSVEQIADCIVSVRNRRIILDAELARLYGVETRVLLQAVRRDAERFPPDFFFQLTNHDVAVLRSQSVISILEAIRQLTAPPMPARRRRIGFVQD